jgi:hypothetical protein
VIELFSESEFINAKYMDELPCRCYRCHSVFYSIKKLISYERNHQLGKIKYCSKSCQKPPKFKLSCDYCQCEIFKAKSAIQKHNFCSQSCAAKFNNSIRPPYSTEHRQKISNSLKLNHSTKPRCVKTKTFTIKTCTICNQSFETKKYRTTCSEICLRQSLVNSGKKSAAIRKKRSKDEIELFDLCFSHFKKVEANKIILDGWDADIIIDDNILILWNGPWHYRDIKIKNVSLTQIRKRDEIKINRFLDHGYTVFIYEDRYFTPKQAFADIIAFYSYQIF